MFFQYFYVHSITEYLLSLVYIHSIILNSFSDLNLFNNCILFQLFRLCCCYAQIPKRDGSISPSKFDGELPNILATFISSTFLLNDYINIFYFSLSVLGDAIVAGLQNFCLCPYFGKIGRV